MAKRTKPHPAPAMRTVGHVQPPTGPGPGNVPPRPVTPDAKGPADTPTESAAELKPEPAAKPATAPLATGQSANAPTEPTAPPPAPEPAAFQPRVYEPVDIACPHQNVDLTNCGAQAGEPCKWQQPVMEGTYHAERIADAAAASQRDGIKSTKEQFDQAVWDSGLF